MGLSGIDHNIGGKMRFWKTSCLLLALTLLVGCAKNKEIAHQIAAQNLYQDIAYENGAKPGPRVVVLPGEVASSSYEFLAQVKPDGLREFAELELGKANFTVLDKNALGDLHQEIALAANLGDGSVARSFSQHDATPPQWLIILDVVDVKTQTTAFTFTDKNAAAVAGALMGGMFLGSAGAQLGSGLVGSINSAEEQRLWDITLKYRILDGGTGQPLLQGTFTEQATITRELKGFLGVDEAQAGGITLTTVAQRLVQKVVQEMDQKHKLPAMASAEVAVVAAAQQPVPAKSVKNKKQPATKQPRIQTQPVPDEIGPDMGYVEKTLGGFVCQLPAQWSTSPPPSAKEVALAKKPELAQLLNHSKRGGKSDLIDAMVEFDIYRTAGPLVTLSDPQSPLLEMGRALAISGDDLEGRFFILPDVASKLTPEKLATAVVEHMRRSSVIEPLAVEIVEDKDGVRRPVTVFKYIQVERRKEVQEQPDWDRDSKPQSKMISIPHYHNMAMALISKGNDLLLVIVTAPEDKFLPHLEGVKKMVGSAV